MQKLEYLQSIVSIGIIALGYNMTWEHRETKF